ncbi:hypothetical protein R230_004474 [Salmonella enterica subsp. enterica serovar Inverness]|nr:hypothetical protein [Salmonella enterica subsp. enterica serovar Inverness]EFT7619474.1 hypothetical protein [Salmonella enterica]
MPKKTKICKAIISVMVFFSLVHLWLNPDVICKVFSETAQTCGNTDAFNSLISFMLGAGLSASLVAMLITWVRKD